MSFCKNRKHIAVIHTDDVALKINAGELYFETEDMDAFLQHLESFDIFYVHKPIEHPWRQRVIRFYDPDGHIIEAAKKPDVIIARFVAQELSPKETADRMCIPLGFVVPEVRASGTKQCQRGKDMRECLWFQ